VQGLREFVDASIIQEISHVRESWGFKTGHLSEKELKAEKNDSNTQKILASSTHVKPS